MGIMSWDLDGGFSAAPLVRTPRLTIRCEYPDTDMPPTEVTFRLATSYGLLTAREAHDWFLKHHCVGDLHGEGEIFAPAQKCCVVALRLYSKAQVYSSPEFHLGEGIMSNTVRPNVVSDVMKVTPIVKGDPPQLLNSRS